MAAKWIGVQSAAQRAAMSAAVTLARSTRNGSRREIEQGWAFVDRDAANRAAQSDSLGAARIRGWVPETITGYRDLEVVPNVRCGFSLIRGGPAFGLVVRRRRL